jgi:hypothetical protein
MFQNFDNFVLICHNVNYIKNDKFYNQKTLLNNQVSNLTESAGFDLMLQLD